MIPSNTKFSEYHQQMLVVISVIRTLWPYRIIQLTSAFESNHRLATMLSRSINPHSRPKYLSTSADAESHSHNLQGNKNPPTYPSQSTKYRHTKIVHRIILNVLHNQLQNNHHFHLHHTGHHLIPSNIKTRKNKILHQDSLPSQVVRNTTPSNLIIHQRPLQLTESSIPRTADRHYDAYWTIDINTKSSVAL